MAVGRIWLRSGRIEFLVSRFTTDGAVVSLPARTVSAAVDPPPHTLLERLRLLREQVADEGHAVLRAADSLSADAVRAAEMTARCNGSVMVTGVGKAGLIGQKLVATLASTGTPAHFLHPAEAVHGDLGRVRGDDLVWAISNSGRSEEVVRIASHVRANSGGLIAITADETNPLAAAADCVVAIGRHDEACPHGLAPTSSTAVMMAVGDSLALLASRLRGFTAQDFARYHPGGALGKKMAGVEQMMRPLQSCRVASQEDSIRQAMVASSRDGRRSGAVMLVDAHGCLAGLFTDSDLARLLEARRDRTLDDPISSRMTAEPMTVGRDWMLRDAIALMSQRRVSELPVIDSEGRPLGMLDITDLVALGDAPEEFSAVQFPA